MNFTLKDMFRLIYSPFVNLFSSGSETYWVFLISGIFLTTFAYRKYHMETSRFSPFGFIRFLFPKKTIMHRSALIDYEMCLLNFFYGGLVSGLILRYFPDIGPFCKRVLMGLFGQ